MIQPNLIGKQAKIINYENTDSYFGYDNEDMGDYIGEIGEIEDVIGCILDDNGRIKYNQHSHEYERDRTNRTLLGVEMFGFSWHIDDIELIEIKERKTKKTTQVFKFNPKDIMHEGKMKNADKPKRSRVNRVVSSKRIGTKSGGSTNKRNSKTNNKRTSKVRK